MLAMGGFLGWADTLFAFIPLVSAVVLALGYDRMRTFHAHFSRIEYSAGGEVRHLTFEDDVFGPDFHPVLDIVRQREYAPRIICESAGTQAEDAKIMKDYYESIRGDQQ